jgi:hypothetical protein
MRATEYGSGAAGAIRSPDFQRAGVLARVHAPRLRWCYVAALAVGFTALPLGHANRSNEDVAQLERLTPRIERARTLSPEAKEAIDRVVARQSISSARAMRRTTRGESWRLSASPRPSRQRTTARPSAIPIAGPMTRNRRRK